MVSSPFFKFVHSDAVYLRRNISFPRFYLQINDCRPVIRIALAINFNLPGSFGVYSRWNFLSVTPWVWQIAQHQLERRNVRQFMKLEVILVRYREFVNVPIARVMGGRESR